MKDYGKNKKPHLKYWDANNLYDWAQINERLWKK